MTDTVVSKMVKQWVCLSGEWYFISDLPTIKKGLPPGIYELNVGMKGPFLRQIDESFVMPEKMYGLENKTVEKVITTFTHPSITNLGVLFKGLKGTGKTITAKVICQKLNLPVILVTHAYDGINDFLTSIEQDIILMFDEFEKVYSLYDYDDYDNNNNEKSKPSIHHLLTLMDGIFTSKYKRLFLMTTNKVNLPDPMESRPSRIRYIKEFSDLSYEGVLEILDTELHEPYRIFNDKILKALSKYENITVDTVKCLAQEINIYKTFNDGMLEGFNIKEPTGKSADLFTVKYDKNGNMLKEEPYDGTLSNTDFLTDSQWFPNIVRSKRRNSKHLKGCIQNVQTHSVGDNIFYTFEVAPVNDDNAKPVSFIARPNIFVHSSFKHVY